MSEKDTIVYINDIYTTGGAPKALLEILAYLKVYSKYKLVVLTPDNNALANDLDELGIENHCIGHRQFCYDEGNTTYLKLRHKILYLPLKVRYLIKNKKAVILAEKYVDFNKVKLIHTNIDRNDVGALLAEKHNIPHLWHIREALNGHFNLRFYRLSPFKYMNSFTNTTYIAISEFVKKTWVEQGLDASKVKILYDSVSNKTTSVEHRQHNNEGVIKIVFGGSITDKKGQWQAVEALSKLDETYQKQIAIDFYGDGDTRYIEELKQKISDYSIKSVVRFVPYTTDFITKLTEYDIGINGSYAEGFGKITVEYLSAGLYTIGTTGGATPEIISDGENGFLFDYGDTDKLADIIKKIVEGIKQNKKLLLRDGKYVDYKFSVECMMEKLLEMYEHT